MLQYYLGGAAIPAQIVVQHPNEALAAALAERRGGKVELRAADAVDPANVAPPRRRPLALPRRVLSEGRDRLAPLLSRSR